MNPPARTPSLDDSLQFLKGVGPRRAELLAKLGLRTARDLLYHFPLRYEEPHASLPIRDVRVGAHVVIEGVIKDIQQRTSTRRRGMTVWDALVCDDSGCIQATWFNRRYLAEKLTAGAKVRLRGKVTFYNQYQLREPEVEVLKEESPSAPRAEPGSRLPVYPATEGMKQDSLRGLVRTALDKYLPLLAELYPPDFLADNQLAPLRDSILELHAPTDPDKMPGALRRLKFDELFRLQLGLSVRAAGIKREDKPEPIHISDLVRERIRNRFPFELTGAQQRAVGEIEADLQAPRAMNRLLIGDVGSGKTAVALWAVLAMTAARRQSALMAPTEILAEQHFMTFSALLADSRIRFALLTSGCSAGERREILAGLESGDLHFVIGTHALIQPDVKFQALQLAIIDEQHKFGVEQRAALRNRAPAVDLLVMTATPIPRSLTMTLYGDLEVSVLDELPKGRGAVRSRWVRPEQTRDMDDFIRERLAEGRQAYFVYPIIEASDAVAWTSAVEAAEELSQRRYKGFTVGLLHGRLARTEKQAVMEKFQRGEIQILVSTTVIEVGIDVPNATVMVVENAVQYGLSQLHQLRGRIGRGPHASYAFFVGEARTPEAMERLRTIENTQDGFKIAETDLRLRGPGEFFGTRQSGTPELRLANLIEDYPLLKLATQQARALLQADPGLRRPEWALLKQDLKRYFSDRWELTTSG